MRILIKERITRNFDILTGELTPSEAREQLAAGNYGIILDQDGVVVALIAAEDLEQAAGCGAPSLLSPLAGLPPTVLVGSEIEMQELADSEAMTLFDASARGAVVFDDEGRIVGILPVETVDEYLGGGEYMPSHETMGPSASVDAGLGGPHQTSLGKAICAECGFVNTLTYLDREHLPVCQNPGKPTHTLKLC
jgi:hypothetical protein